MKTAEIQEFVEIDGYDCDFSVECFDGYGIATSKDGSTVLKMEYPKISSLSQEEKEACLHYRGLSPITDNICFGDVMMLYGKPRKL